MEFDQDRQFLFLFWSILSKILFWQTVTCFSLLHHTSRTWHDHHVFMEILKYSYENSKAGFACMINKRLVKALAHYSWNCKKSSYPPYTLQLCVTTATIYLTVLYMGSNFHNNIFRKIFAVLCVVWRPWWSIKVYFSAQHA